MKLFRRKEKRDLTSSRIPLNSEGYGNYSGVSVTTESSLRLAAVYGSVSAVSNALSTTPIDIYRRTGNNRVELPSPQLLESPSGSMTPVEWKSAVFNSALLRGNAYGFKDDFDDLEYPRQIHLMHPDEVSIERRSREDPTPVYRFNGEEVPRVRVFHLPGFMFPGALEGLSPVRYFAQTIGTGLASGNYGAQFFGGGGHPTAVLETDQAVNQEQAETILARIRAKLNNGRREPIILAAGTSWKPIQVPPAEAMWLESSKFSALEIASMIFHVPASMLGLPVEGTSLTYSNREQDFIHFQTMALLPWAIRFEQYISRLLPGRQFIKLNMDAAVRVDLTTRYQAHQIGIDAGFLTTDEARQLEDRPPLDDTSSATARQLAEMIQKIYLGVGVVISVDEAREILNREGAGLTGTLPPPPAPPAPVVEEEPEDEDE